MVEWTFHHSSEASYSELTALLKLGATEMFFVAFFFGKIFGILTWTYVTLIMHIAGFGGVTVFGNKEVWDHVVLW